MLHNQTHCCFLMILLGQVSSGLSRSPKGSHLLYLHVCLQAEEQMGIPLTQQASNESRLSMSESVSEFFDAQEVLLSASSSENEVSQSLRTASEKTTLRLNKREGLWEQRVHKIQLKGCKCGAVWQLMRTEFK